MTLVKRSAISENDINYERNCNFNLVSLTRQPPNSYQQPNSVGIRSLEIRLLVRIQIYLVIYGEELAMRIWKQRVPLRPGHR